MPQLRGNEPILGLNTEDPLARVSACNSKHKYKIIKGIH